MTQAESKERWIAYYERRITWLDKLANTQQTSLKGQIQIFDELRGKIADSDIEWMQRNIDRTREELEKTRSEIAETRKRLDEESKDLNTNQQQGENTWTKQ